MRFAPINIVLVSTLAGGLLMAQPTLPVHPGQSQAQQSQPPAQSTLTRDRIPTPEEIIQAFSAKETEFYGAWTQYAYRQIAQVRILSVDGHASRERLTLISDIIFHDDGTREVRQVERRGGLQSVEFSKNDEEVINNLQPFALTAKELPLYNLKYEGKEKVDELTCYVFAVKPKSTKGNRFYFEGKIWVDDEDLQVVRTVGRPVPQKRNEQFPEFETLRQVVDQKYWFPVWTHADSVLSFPDKNVRVEETITYEEYKRFGSTSTITFGPKK
jgi:hypothetical protein